MTLVRSVTHPIRYRKMTGDLLCPIFITNLRTLPIYLFNYLLRGVGVCEEGSEPSKLNSPSPPLYYARALLNGKATSGEGKLTNLCNNALQSLYSHVFKYSYRNSEAIEKGVITEEDPQHLYCPEGVTS